jgi:hypothetical protein
MEMKLSKRYRISIMDTIHGEDGGLANPMVVMNAKTAMINTQNGKNEDPVSINNAVSSLINIVQKNTDLLNCLKKTLIQCKLFSFNAKPSNMNCIHFLAVTADSNTSLLLVDCIQYN